MHDAFLFLEDDRQALVNEIQAVAKEIKRVQGETAESTEQTSETWHDNFMFEEGERQMRLLAERLEYLNDVLARAEVVEKRHGGTSGVGSTVTFVDEASGATQTVEIGSYLILDQRPGVASYESPLGRLLFGARPGDVREGSVGSSIKRVNIVDVQ